MNWRPAITRPALQPTLACATPVNDDTPVNIHHCLDPVTRCTVGGMATRRAAGTWPEQVNAGKHRRVGRQKAGQGDVSGCR